MPKKENLPDRGIVRVTFELPAEVQGNVIHLVGDFTGWEGTPMEKQPDGSWRTTVDLAPASTYEFRYLIDGMRWENDWAADQYVSNAFGQENSVVTTPQLHGGAAAQNTQATAPAAKSPAAKKSAATKPAAKSPAAKKSAATKPAAKKPAAKSPAAKKSAAKKSAATKPTATKPAAKKSAAGSSPSGAPAKKAPQNKGSATAQERDGSAAGRASPTGSAPRDERSPMAAAPDRAAPDRAAPQRTARESAPDA